jgi:hypothetical protein
MVVSKKSLLVIRAHKEIFSSRFEDGFLSLSVDIKEMRQGIAQTFHNIPEGAKPI